MLILAFDTSGFSGSVAVLEGARVLSEASLPAELRSAQTLAAAIVEVMRSAGIEAKQVGLVATTVGPGSFTGLRVGVTTAKTFAYAAGAQVLGVSTLESIAHQVPAEMLRFGLGEIQVVLDAQRKEVFLGRFVAVQRNEPPDGPIELRRLEADRLVAVEDWLAALRTGDLVTGSGLKRLQERLPAGVAKVDEVAWEPRASIVGRLAWRDFESGQRDSLWKLTPVYLRASYAEEKARSKT